MAESAACMRDLAGLNLSLSVTGPRTDDHVGAVLYGKMQDPTRTRTSRVDAYQSSSSSFGGLIGPMEALVGEFPKSTPIFLVSPFFSGFFFV